MSDKREMILTFFLSYKHHVNEMSELNFNKIFYYLFPSVVIKTGKDTFGFNNDTY